MPPVRTPERKLMKPKQSSAFSCAVAAAFALVAVFAITGTARAADQAEKVGATTCVGCHAEYGSFSKSIHGKAWPSRQKIAFEQSCETCHGAGSLHANSGGDKSNPDFASIKKPTALTVADQSAMCLSCHKKEKELMAWGTGAHKQNGVSCLKCHSMHKGEGKAQLAKSETETCLNCHKNKRADLQLASHHPILEGKMGCTGCHNPHGGVEANLKADSLEETCFKCHADKAGPYAFEHPPVGESCANCHKPHGSQNAYLLKQAQPFLCMRCHKWPHVERSNGVNATSITNLEQRARCTDCHHEIHGSDRHAAFKN